MVACAQRDLSQGRASLTTMCVDIQVPEGQYVLFAKIDSQGHDFKVLKGADRLLSEGRILVFSAEVCGSQSMRVSNAPPVTCCVPRVHQRCWYTSCIVHPPSGVAGADGGGCKGGDRDAELHSEQGLQVLRLPDVFRNWLPLRAAHPI